MKSTLTGVVKRIEIKPSRTEGIDSYDIDNCYTQRIKDIINASGTGTLVTDMMAKFIYGNGFADKEFGKLVVNSEGLTANQLLRMVSQSIAYFKGFTPHVNYTMDKITEVNFLPFEFVRKTSKENEKNPNQLAVYNDWQKINGRIDTKKIDYINYFNPLKVLEQVELAGGWEFYKGQILYVNLDGGLYPLSPLDSVIEDVQTDAKSKNFKYRNITTNFMASHIMTVGEFESQDQRNDFVENLSGFQGDDDALQIMLVEEKAGVDSSFKLTKVDIQDVDKLYQYTEESVQRNIIRCNLIPPVLLLDTSDGFSDGKMKDATALYNGQTQDFRDLVSEVFAKLFTGFKGTNFTDFSIELRKASTVEIKDTVEGKAKIVEIIGNSSLSINQKKKILTMIYGMNEDEAILLTLDENVVV